MDFIFKSYSEVLDKYNVENDGPLFQAVDKNPNLVRVTQHKIEGNHVYDFGALRTQIQFGVVPLPASAILLGSGLLGLVGLGRFRKR